MTSEESRVPSRPSPNLTRMRASLVLPLAALFAGAVGADAQKPQDPRLIQPERPTVATHAHTVAPGYLEIEAGVQADRIAKGERATVAPVVLKFGLASHLQLNVSTFGYFAAPGQSSGLGDIAAGLKWRLLDEHPVLGDFAVLPQVKFPTGSRSRGTGSGTTDIGVTAIASYLVGALAVDLNATYTRVGRSDFTPATDAALWTASFGFPLRDAVGMVVEFFGAPTIDGSNAPSSVALLIGPTFLVKNSLGLDVGVITPLHGEIPNAIYAGFVWNVGRIAGSGPRDSRMSVSHGRSSPRP